MSVPLTASRIQGGSRGRQRLLTHIPGKDFLTRSPFSDRWRIWINKLKRKKMNP
jgi:hypothetical protein